MNNIRERVIRPFFVSSMITLLVLTGVVISNAEKMDVSKAVFYVG